MQGRSWWARLHGIEPPRLVRFWSWIRRREPRPRDLLSGFNYWYAVGWLAYALGTFMSLKYVETSWADVLTGVALWRLAEILVGQTKMLLDWTHTILLAPERN